MLKKTPEVGEFVSYTGGSDYFDKKLIKFRSYKVVASYPEDSWFSIEIEPENVRGVVIENEENDDYRYFDLVEKNLFIEKDGIKSFQTGGLFIKQSNATIGYAGSPPEVVAPIKLNENNTIEIKNTKQVEISEVKAGQVRCNEYGEFVLVINSGKVDGRFNAIVIDSEDGFYPHYYHEIDADEHRIKNDYPILCNSRIEIW